jgi:type VI secretion system protein ImpA
MDILDVDALLEPISDESPCGEDLEYDPEFGAMERASQGAEEQQFGDTIVEAKPAEWREVKSQALNLFKRTKDLRVASYLARAVLHMHGLVAFQSGLALIHRMIAESWEPMFPRLDPDDDNDPTIRVNTLLTLCDENDTLPAVRTAWLVQSRTVGQFCLRDVLLATGDLTLPEGSDAEIPSLSTIDAAFMDVDVEILKTTAKAVSDAVDDMIAIEQLLMDKVGSSHAVDLTALTNDLKQMRTILTDRLQRRGVSEPAEEAEGAAEGEEASAGSNGAEQRVLSINDLRVRSRDEVIRTLDKICEYYQQHEPSSPLPLLLERAKRLVPLGFLELIRDLAPDAIAQAEALRGSYPSSEE